MFADLLKIVIEGGYGVRAYEDCARQARARIGAEPEHAVALLLIAYAAQRFVDAFDDQPLPVDEANDELTRFSSMVKALEASVVSGNAEKQLTQMNAVAAKLLENAKA